MLHRKHTFFAPLIISACILFALPAAAQNRVTLTSGEWPPYFSKDLPYGGLAARIYHEAFALEGIEIEYEYQPWKRGFESAKIGHFDGSVGWRRSPEREKHFYFSDPLFMTQTVIFHRLGDDFDWKTLEDLGDLKIGVTLGYIYIKTLQPIVENGGGSLDFASKDILSFEKLAAGRIDAFPCSKEVGLYILSNLMEPAKAKEIRYHPRNLTDGGIHLIVSQKVPHGQQIIERFNRGLRKLQDNGLYEVYLDQTCKEFNRNGQQ